MYRARVRGVYGVCKHAAVPAGSGVSATYCVARGEGSEERVGSRAIVGPLCSQLRSIQVCDTLPVLGDDKKRPVRLMRLYPNSTAHRTRKGRSAGTALPRHRVAATSSMLSALGFATCSRSSRDRAAAAGDCPSPCRSVSDRSSDCCPQARWTLQTIDSFPAQIKCILALGAKT